MSELLPSEKVDALIVAAFDAGLCCSQDSADKLIELRHSIKRVLAPPQPLRLEITQPGEYEITNIRADGTFDIRRTR